MVAWLVVRRGCPDEEELAALAAMLGAVLRAPAPPVPVRAWGSPALAPGEPDRPGPDAWRLSALP
ncbi:acyl-CoA carboxylase epsilon subunit [Amycolatopsis suaedae]|uniref:Acyl-CoA carboxylase subunit epsilon n=1 Tax=Amycolatopsis suaedae TaxID=2510978 RepID=A0A4Q7J2J2_9PSEU|nr:acyl-CoA carboxylase epsilon subunit [Amycolatopsis suaedae]RZQ61127.1 acyl-CoA carboxylase subunit epsilon [Amycolatopsis suaedae]